ncbi:Uncharacterized protein dnm_023520 [Desulfonema magnum]|uniref:Uncharacterized protein n=1 Tax=Desulfonema magnum TaxID=45655 RepID=A0A975BJ65_9BACT|nr:Uncharacterized protein dnm_023520 [Desulfonema magnum]
MRFIKKYKKLLVRYLAGKGVPNLQFGRKARFEDIGKNVGWVQRSETHRLRCL